MLVLLLCAGGWNLAKAPAMKWTEGDLWNVSLELQVGGGGRGQEGRGMVWGGRRGGGWLGGAGGEGNGRGGQEGRRVVGGGGGRRVKGVVAGGGNMVGRVWNRDHGANANCVCLGAGWEGGAICARKLKDAGGGGGKGGAAYGQRVDRQGN